MVVVVVVFCCFVVFFFSISIKTSFATDVDNDFKFVFFIKRKEKKYTHDFML